jgi:hypothetical protein
MVREGVDGGIGGIKSLVKNGVKASAKSIATAGVKGVATTLGKGVASAAAGATIRATTDIAKDKGNKLVARGANATGAAAAKMYTRVATDRMNARAKTMTAAQRAAYLKAEQANIAKKAAKIQSGTTATVNVVGKAAVGLATEYARDKATGAAKAKIASLGTQRAAEPSRTFSYRKLVRVPKPTDIRGHLMNGVRKEAVKETFRTMATRQANTMIGNADKALQSSFGKVVAEGKRRLALRTAASVAAYGAGDNAKEAGITAITNGVRRGVNAARAFFARRSAPPTIVRRVTADLRRSSVHPSRTASVSASRSAVPSRVTPVRRSTTASHSSTRRTSTTASRHTTSHSTSRRSSIPVSRRVTPVRRATSTTTRRPTVRRVSTSTTRHTTTTSASARARAAAAARARATRTAAIRRVSTVRRAAVRRISTVRRAAVRRVSTVRRTTARRTTTVRRTTARRTTTVRRTTTTRHTTRRTPVKPTNTTRTNHTTLRRSSVSRYL